uniref:Uncharacterized protein n=1 Tax=Labrus bergylta TaxID=56723 RepID=A0A3Q3H405_9LABR
VSAELLSVYSLIHDQSPFVCLQLGVLDNKIIIIRQKIFSESIYTHIRVFCTSQWKTRANISYLTDFKIDSISFKRWRVIIYVCYFNSETARCDVSAELLSVYSLIHDQSPFVCLHISTMIRSVLCRFCHSQLESLCLSSARCTGCFLPSRYGPARTSLFRSKPSLVPCYDQRTFLHLLWY